MIEQQAGRLATQASGRPEKYQTEMTHIGSQSKMTPVKTLADCMYLACFTEQEIAERTGITQQAINLKLPVLQKQFPGTNLVKLSLYDDDTLEVPLYTVWVAQARIRAERRAGEMLREREMNTGTKGQLIGRGIIGSSIMEPPIDIPTLSDLGINKAQSYRWQTMADVPEEKRKLARENIKSGTLLSIDRRVETTDDLSKTLKVGYTTASAFVNSQKLTVNTTQDLFVNSQKGLNPINTTQDLAKTLLQNSAKPIEPIEVRQAEKHE